MKVYAMLQRRIVESEREEEKRDQELPVALRKNKKKAGRRELPVLSLRTRGIMERELPLSADQTVLMLSSAERKIIVQKPKLFGDELCITSVSQHKTLECWIWEIYVQRTSRTFTVGMYVSDVYNLSEVLLDNPRIG